MSTVIYDINGNIVTSIDESPEMIVNSAGAPINPSTSDLQATANTDISSINTKTPALGQALAAASVPVVLTAAQLATLTPPTTVTVIQPTGTNLHTIIDNASIAVTGTFFQATQPVSIASPVAVTGGLTDAQLRASPITITGSITATNNANGITGSAVPANATQIAGSDGTNLRPLKVSTLGVLSVDGSAVTQPVSIASPVAVTGALTNSELRATAVPVSIASSVSVTGTFFQATQPVSGTVIANLGTIAGVATESTLGSLNTKIPTGLTVKPASTPAVAADQALVVTLSPNNPIVVSAITGSVEISNDVGNPIPVNGTVTISNPGLTDTQLRATALPVSLASTTISNFPTTQPVSGTVTVSNPGLTDTQLRATPVAISGTVSTGSLTNTELRASLVPVSLTSTTVTNTVTVSAASLPLPIGAATASNQTAANSSLSSIDSKLTSPLTVTGPLTDIQLRAAPVPVSLTSTTITGSVAVTGTVIANLGTIAGAATETTLSSLNTKVPTGLTIKAASTPAVAADQALVVTLSPNNPIVVSAITGSVEISNDVGNPIPVSGTVAVSNPGLTDTQLRASAIPVSLTSTTVSSSALPTGASTSALQTSGNSTLTSVDAKTPALGQALATASTPVVLTAAQISTLTPLTSVTVTQAIGTNLHTVIDSGSVNAAVTGTVSVSNFPASQAVSGTVTVANPGLTDTQLRATALPVSLASTTVTGSVAVTGPLTDTQLRAVAVPVSLASTTVTNFPATQAVSIASSVAVTGPLTNTELRLTPVPISGTVSTGLAQPITDTQIRATALPVSLTSTTITGSVATTLASTTITNFPASQAVTGTFFQATQPVSAVALPLPSGASTETTLSALNTKIPAGLVVTTGRLQVELPAGSGGLTDTQLRATAVPVSLVSTTITGSVAVTGPLTDTQLRLTAVPISGTVAISNPGLTDTQLRATALPVSLASTTITGTVTTSSASLPLPTGAATSAGQTTMDASVNSLLKPASTLAAVTSITNTVTIKADTPANQVNALKVDGSAVTQPVSGSVNVNRVAIIGSAPATANTTTTSAIVVPANASRKGLTIINLTSTRVYLSFEGNTAVVNSGIMLANGGSFSMDNFSFTLGAVRAIVASGTSILSIQEFA